jgi:hypothetical protein
MKRLPHVLGVAALVLVASALGLPGASAAAGGLLRLAHLSPDTPAVDVYVNSVADPGADVTLSGVPYGIVSPYRTVPPGVYTVSMRLAGAPASSPPVLSRTVQVAAGTAQTVAGVGHHADLGLKVLADDLTSPPAGQVRVRVVAAAATANSLDVSVPDGPALAAGLAFGTTGDYVDVPGRSTTLSITSSGGAATTVPVQLQAGSVYSVLVLDRPGGGLTVRPILDAAGPGTVPAGSVPAGEGGTAGRAGGGVSAGVIAVVAATAGAGLLTTMRVRLPRRGSPGRHAGGH